MRVARRASASGPSSTSSSSPLVPVQRAIFASAPDPVSSSLTTDMTNPTDSTQDATLHPFTIEVPDTDLQDLRDRLARTRLPHPLPGDGWERGVPVGVLRDLVDRWAAHDWRASEERLNRLPQVSTRIDGQTIHAVHVRSEVPGAVPLLLTHGWPGSFLELEDVIGPLTDPQAHGGRAEDAFHVVIPSLPGFGFSTPLELDGWTTERIARAWVELTDRLGCDRFAVQGGDIGPASRPRSGGWPPTASSACTSTARWGCSSTRSTTRAAGLTDLERDRLKRIGAFMQDEYGYIAIRGTRPGLVGAMAADSPVAQLAWIVDKLQAWSWPAHAPATEVLVEEFVLANVSLYWFTASAGSAASVGYAQAEHWGQEPASSGVPTAALQLAHDIGLRFAAEQGNEIVRWTDVEDRGGHFAALEEPALLVEDVRAFLRPLR